MVDGKIDDHEMAELITKYDLIEMKKTFRKDHTNNEANTVKLRLQ